MAISPSGRPVPAQLAVIRMAMLGGVLLFGAVTWFLHRRPDFTPVGGLERLSSLAPAVMLVSAAGIIAVRWYLARLTNATSVRNAQLGAWTIGEAAALFGGVYYFTMDDPRFYIIGLFVMLASFIIVPLRR